MKKIRIKAEKKRHDKTEQKNQNKREHRQMTYIYIINS